MSDISGSSLSNIEQFIANQAKLNHIMNDFMSQTTQTLANADVKTVSLLDELKKLREEQTSIAQPLNKN